MIRSLSFCAGLVLALPVGAADPVVKPDPAAKLVVWPAALPALDFPDSSHPLVIPADHTGPFVAAGRSTVVESTFVVLDLTTGKKVGGWKTELSFVPAKALGPDGKLFVGVGYKPGNPAPKRQAVLAGFDAATGKQVWEVPTTVFPRKIQFAGPDRVLVDQGFGPNGFPELYDAKTGALVRAIDIGPVKYTSRAVSPGGRYLAYAEDPAGVVIRATEDGKVLHTFPLPQAPQGAWRSCMEIAFSPDGNRLAAAFTPSGSTVRMLGWNLATGEREADCQFTSVLGSSVDRHFWWTADGAAWLVHGAGVVDAVSGAVLWKPPPLGTFTWATVPVSAHRVVQFDSSDSRQPPRVREVGLPADRVAAAVKAARSGGGAVDGWLPPLKAADRSTTRTIVIPARAEDWTYEPDGVPESGTPVRLMLPVLGTEVSAALVTRSAAVVETVRQSDRGFPDPLAPRHLIRVELATGKVTGRVELPHVCRLVAVSPDAAAAVTVDLDAGRRVDVWDLATGKHTGGWRPADPKADGGPLQYVAALSAERVLTLTRTGELAAWSVKTGAVEYVADLGGAGPPTASPGGKYLFVPTGDVVRVINTGTGALAGDLPTGLKGLLLQNDLQIYPERFPFTSLAARADGAELVGLYQSGPRREWLAVRWDLRSAKLLARDAMTWTGRTTPLSRFEKVRYASRDHLLLNAAALYGLKSRSEEWQYTTTLEYPPPTVAGSRPDGRLWYVAPEPSSSLRPAVVSGLSVANRRAVLVAADLPDPLAAAALKAVAGGAENLLGPGRKVALRFELEGAPNDQARDAVRATLRDWVKARGVEPTDAAADAVLTLSVNDNPGYKTGVYTAVEGDNKPPTQVTVTVPFFSTKVTLAVGGKVVFDSGLTFQGGPAAVGGVLRLPTKDTDVEKFIREKSWASLGSWLVNVGWPQAVIRTPEGLVVVPGTSELSPDGLRPSTRAQLPTAPLPKR